MPTSRQFQRIRFILGDQLNLNHSWFNSIDPGTLYVLAEMQSELLYTRHHIQKITAFFLAMETFASQLSADGHSVLYLTLDDTVSDANLNELLARLTEQFNASVIEFQRPDEFRLFQHLRHLDTPVKMIKEFDTEHFLVPFEQLGKHFKEGKAARLEAFYRRLRKQFDILMEMGAPTGGQWNYDSSNRKRLKKTDISSLPDPKTFHNDAAQVLERLNRHEIPYIGKETNIIQLPINRQQSLELLDFFCTHCLKMFGDFQDAMTQSSEHAWSLYHSRLSFSLNTKMLHPKEVVDRAINEFEKRNDIDISQIEGFVRQVLGWREYIRGIYWMNMPNYSKTNFLKANRNLPTYFWDGQTQMNCISRTVNQSLETAYAHHIQRLMVTGEFALLAGIEPTQVDEWYLGIYADAVEWVQKPNTRGMSQYADGGLVASKPYAASGNYINKMSDYCRDCSYNVKSRSDEDSCPFNSLYWHFIDRHRSLLEDNARLKMAYLSWDRFDEATRSRTLTRAHHCIENLESL